MKALDSNSISSKLVLQCREELELLSHWLEITLVSVPGHRNIRGNEIADELARKGSTLDIAEAVAISTPLNTITASIASHYHALAERNISHITATLAGHWKVEDHAARLNLSFNPICRSCQAEGVKESLFHYLSRACWGTIHHSTLTLALREYCPTHWLARGMEQYFSYSTYHCRRRNRIPASPKNSWYDEECHVAAEMSDATRTMWDRYRELKKEERRIIRKKKREAEIRECEELEMLANRNNTRKFYQKVRRLTEGFKTFPVRTKTAI